MPVQLSVSYSIRPSTTPSRRALRRSRPLYAHVTFPDDFTADGSLDVIVAAYDGAVEEVDPAAFLAWWSLEGVELSEELRSVRLPVALPRGVTQVRFRAVVRPEASNDGSAQAEPGPGSVAGRANPALETVDSQVYDVHTSGTPRVVGTALPPYPSIYTIIQGLQPVVQGDDQIDTVLDHVVARLQLDYEQEVWSRYGPLDGEIGENGQTIDHESWSMPSWHKELIRTSGNYYKMSPRRCIQNLEAGIGYPTAGVCNNLTDVALFTRGWTNNPGGDGGGMGVGFSCTPVTLGLLRARVEAAGGDAFIDELTGSNRIQSFNRTRPGSVIVWNNTSGGDGGGGDAGHNGHICIVLRVRTFTNASGQTRREVQLFDTGGVTRAVGTVPHALGTSRKAWKETSWLDTLPQVASYGFPAAHAWFPINPAVSEDRRRTRRPLFAAGGIKSRVVNEQGRTVPGSCRTCGHLLDASGRPCQPPRPPRRRGAPASEPRPPAPTCGCRHHLYADDYNVERDPYLASHEAQTANTTTRLQDEAEGPETYLAVFNREENGRLKYLSRPFRLGVPLTTLVATVAHLPHSERWEARWYVRVWGPDWSTAIVIEIFNDEGGIARQYRPAIVDSGETLPHPFTTRLDELTEERRDCVAEGGSPPDPAVSESSYDARLGPLVEADGAGRPAHREDTPDPSDDDHAPDAADLE